MSTNIKSNRGRKSTKKTIEQKESPENIKTLYEFYDIKPIKLELNNMNSNNTQNLNTNDIFNNDNDTEVSSINTTNESTLINTNNTFVNENNNLVNKTTDDENNNLNNNIVNNTNDDDDENNNLNNNIVNNTNDDDANNNLNNNINNTNDDDNNEQTNETTQKVYKKRGRKPKGGKIIKQPILVKDESILKKNVILHLKCSINDVDDNIFGNNTSYNPNIIENVGGYSFNNKELQFDYVKSKEIVDYESIIYSNKPINLNNTIINDVQNNDLSISNTITSLNSNILKNNLIQSLNNINQNNIQSSMNNNKQNNVFNNDEPENNNVKDIWRKLSELEKSLHNNDVYDKKSSCFWDTCEFDNPPIYIPKFELNGVVHVYGCFCSPECATAHLMKENIDTTTKFERYHLLNHTYCKIYNYEKNIKPSPSPYYTLNKYYGNLSIQEYRKLLKNERLLLIVDKPLTIQLPELHQDNDEHIINNSIPSTAKYKLRRKGVKQTKNEILNETFGLCK
jgi:hypothetical protein